MTEVQRFLFDHADSEYRAFTLPLMPKVPEDTFIGVRIPVIRSYAKTMDDPTKKVFLSDLPHPSHDENILHAVILSNIKDYREFIREINRFLPYVTNWSVCDTICNKHLSHHKEKLIHEVVKWIQSGEVYSIRYGVKCLMNYYLDDAFSPEHLKWVEAIDNEDYYARMMVAWYVATGLAKNYESFVPLIEQRRLDSFTHNKAIQKAIESYRVSDDHKAYLKTLKA